MLAPYSTPSPARPTDRNSVHTITTSPFRLLSSSFSTSSKPRSSGSGSSVLLASALLCCAGIIAYVHVSQKTSQEKMHRAVVVDKERLKARLAAQREAARQQTNSGTTGNAGTPTQ